VVHTTAIIGAGVAGLACAQALQQAGRSVVVFDKGRNPGGRLATRRTNHASFDHGAQFIRARDAVFASWLADLARHASAERWPALDKPAGRAERAAPAWVGKPDMNALLAPITDTLNVTRSTNIADITRGTSGWVLTADDGTTRGPYDNVVVAIPVPQAAAMLTGLASPAFAPLANVEYAPCMTAMIAFEQRIDTAPCHAYPENGPIGWFCRSNAKPGNVSRHDAFVVQASPEWSTTHQNDEKPTIAKALLAAFTELYPQAAISTPDHLEGHRWRYALVTKPVGRPCLANPGIRLAVAGDGLLGPNVEAAFLSGRAAAREVLSWTCASQP